MSFTFKVFRGSASGDIVESAVESPPLSRDEMHIETTHSGVCGTDAHMRRMPRVLGHEGIGVIKALGPDVKILKIGDRVGWGFTTDSCGACDQCRAGRYSSCPDLKMNFDIGAFSSGVVIREPYVFRIPDAMESADAAPMMCAGTTVWGVLSQYGCKSTDCVGILGIGGLGHLAIQFAAKMGCEVVAFSGTEEKKDDALSLGARHFVATKDQKELTLPRKINHLLVTADAMPDWDLFLPIMEAGCTVYPLLLTSRDATFTIPHMPFSWQSVKLVYPGPATMAEHHQMLEFAAFHGIKPVIAKFPLTRGGIVESMEKLKEGKIRYRGVLYAEGEEYKNSRRRVD